MAHTSHGHHIPGTIKSARLGRVGRCGGPGMCQQCTREASMHTRSSTEAPSATAEDFLLEGKVAVVNEVNEDVEVGREISVEDVLVVWFSKTLKNWKAVYILNPALGSLYYEVTHNGEKNETYIDTYRKVKNSVVR